MNFVEGLFKVIIVLAIVFGLDLFLAQMVAFLLSSYGVNSGLVQDFFAVVLLSVIAGGSAKAAK